MLMFIFEVDIFILYLFEMVIKINYGL